MIVTIHQPQFMPWLGYFDKMDRADHFVVLDSVQFKKNEWQNRNRIKTPQGPQWLTVPVSYRFPARLDEVSTNATVNWRHKLWQALLTNYARAPHWADCADSLKLLLAEEYPRLVDINVASIQWLRTQLGVTTPTSLSSQFDCSDDPTQRLIDLCLHHGGTTYLSGPDGEKYLDVSRFTDQGIDVIFHSYEHPEYDQLHGEFISHLTCLDLVLNHGERSMDIVRDGRD